VSGRNGVHFTPPSACPRAIAWATRERIDIELALGLPYCRRKADGQIASRVNQRASDRRNCGGLLDLKKIGDYTGPALLELSNVIRQSNAITPRRRNRPLLRAANRVADRLLRVRASVGCRRDSVPSRPPVPHSAGLLKGPRCRPTSVSASDLTRTAGVSRGVCSGVSGPVANGGSLAMRSARSGSWPLRIHSTANLTWEPTTRITGSTTPVCPRPAANDFHRE
jgi:hypothetical protein